MAGLHIDAQRGSGYQLRQPLELLQESKIRRGLETSVSAALDCIEIHESIESTSDWLRGLPPPLTGRFAAVLAEYQTGGRGRRGRQWLSPFGGGLCLSVNRWFATVPVALSALSLAVGVGVCRVLRNDVAELVSLKWPNDIVAGDGKLGGLLVDVQGEADGPLQVVIGIGLNFSVSAAMVAEVTQAGGLLPIGLDSLTDGVNLSRNKLAARLINEMHTVLTEFEQHGFAAFVDEWCRYDWLAGRAVTARIGQHSLSGTARGITDEGALLIDSNGELQHLVSGEVSLRPDCLGEF